MGWKEDRRQQYLEKLRDPRWQKKRLEVMQRDEFACQICFDTKSTLNVHHNYYTPDTEPWDYPLDALVTLCQECHEEETATRSQEEELLLRVLRQIGMKSGHINGLLISLDTTFGTMPQFPDNWDYTISRFFKHFYRFNRDISELADKYTNEARKEIAEQDSKRIDS